jgi:hypothetical protein
MKRREFITQVGRDARAGLDQAMLDAKQSRCAVWRRSVEAMENGWKS